MASKSLPKIRRWSNLHRACQAPLDCLRPIGEVCQLAWSSPGFLRPAQHDIPDKSRFLRTFRTPLEPLDSILVTFWVYMFYKGNNQQIQWLMRMVRDVCLGVLASIPVG